MQSAYIDKKHVTLIVLLVLSAAFYTADHKILIEWLWAARIINNLPAISPLRKNTDIRIGILYHFIINFD